MWAKNLKPVQASEHLVELFHLERHHALAGPIRKCSYSSTVLSLCGGRAETPPIGDYGAFRPLNARSPESNIQGASA